MSSWPCSLHSEKKIENTCIADQCQMIIPAILTEVSDLLKIQSVYKQRGGHNSFEETDS